MRGKNKATQYFEMLLILNVQTQEDETLPSCLTNGMNMVVEFQFPSPTCFGLRAFKTFRRSCFPPSPFQVVTYFITIFVRGPKKGALELGDSLTHHLLGHPEPVLHKINMVNLHSGFNLTLKFNSKRLEASCYLAKWISMKCNGPIVGRGRGKY